MKKQTKVMWNVGLIGGLLLLLLDVYKRQA